jgi:hypothetical protein
LGFDDLFVFADEIAKLFPNLYGQPSAAVVPAAEPVATKPLKIGVVLSGGQAPGGHNVICGIFGECQWSQSSSFALLNPQKFQF